MYQSSQQVLDSGLAKKLKLLRETFDILTKITLLKLVGIPCTIHFDEQK